MRLSKKTKLLTLTGALTAILVGVAWMVFSRDAWSGRLLDGSRVTLQAVTFGQTHASPPLDPPGILRILPKKWLSSLNWKEGTQKSSTTKNDIFVFWLKWNNGKGDQHITYAIADEHGFESPVPFSGPHSNYSPSGFGKKWIGQARGFGLFPRRSKRFYLRLYQQGKDGRLVRIANFPVTNPAPARTTPEWVATPLPAAFRTNNLAFTLETALVGITPGEEIKSPYNRYPGQWSQFTFRAAEDGQPVTGWTVPAISIFDSAGYKVRTSGQGYSSLNGTFDRTDNDRITCIHRWNFWPGEPAWKLQVRFRHENKPDVWADYYIQPQFLDPHE